MRNLGNRGAGDRSKSSYKIKEKRKAKVTSVGFHGKIGWMLTLPTLRGNIGEERVLFGWREKMNLILENVDYEGLLFIHEEVGNTGLRTPRSELEIGICSESSI